MVVARAPDLLGREPYLTVLSDGTLFLTGHLLAADVRNPHGYTCGFIHRSTDRGLTWKTLRIASEGVKPRANNHTSRNVLECADRSREVEPAVKGCEARSEP